MILRMTNLCGFGCPEKLFVNVENHDNPMELAVPHFQNGLIEGSLEAKLPTIWIDGKAEVVRISEEKSRRKKIREEKESEERKCRRAVFFQ